MSIKAIKVKQKTHTFVPVLHGTVIFRHKGQKLAERGQIVKA